MRGYENGDAAEEKNDAMQLLIKAIFDYVIYYFSFLFEPVMLTVVKNNTVAASQKTSEINGKTTNFLL